MLVQRLSVALIWINRRVASVRENIVVPCAKKQNAGKTPRSR
jgi:hypothetical protein